MTSRCEWCRDPMDDPLGAGFCSSHCAAQHRASTEKRESAPLAWDGETLFASQPPLALQWRLTCLLCGRDRWLRMPLAEASHMRSGPCPGCQGFRVLELDQGIQRPGDGIEAAA